MLDSGSNRWVVHDKNPARVYNFSMDLAHGSCPCDYEIARKGVPKAIVPWDPKGSNIDLVPELFLWVRGCKIIRDDTCYIVTPKKRKFELKFWNGANFLDKQSVQQIFDDLPEADAPGRFCDRASVPTVSRACRAECTHRQLREDLSHLGFDKTRMSHIKSKYADLPDTYYQGVQGDYVTPQTFKESSVSYGTSTCGNGSLAALP